MFKLNKLSENLLNAMAEKDCTQKQLANYLNTTHATVNRWIKGVNEPNLDNIVLLCHYFNYSSDELLGIKEISDIDFEIARIEKILQDRETEEYEKLSKDNSDILAIQHELGIDKEQAKEYQKERYLEYLKMQLEENK